MRATEGGKEVVERVLVGDVDGGEVEVSFVVVGMEDVRLADGYVEETARGDSLRVLVVVASVGCGDVDEVGRELIGRARNGNGLVGVARWPLQVKPASNSWSAVMGIGTLFVAGLGGATLSTMAIAGVTPSGMVVVLLPQGEFGSVTP